MLRDILIDRELFQELREKALESDDGENSPQEVELLEKAVFNRLKKKRSVKKYKKLGVTKRDLKEIIALADIIGLDAIGGPSNYELAKDHQEWCSICGRCCRESESIFIHKDELNLLLTQATESALKEVKAPRILHVATHGFFLTNQSVVSLESRGLVLDQGDYTLSGEKTGEVHRYQISLPVYGEYVEVRSFIARALNENPAPALAPVEMGREVIEDTDLETTLRFTLFLKEAK